MNFCPKCGAELQGKFCSECGYNTQKEKKAIKMPKFLLTAWSFIKAHKKPVIIGTTAGVAVLTAAIVLIVALSNIFRIGKVEKIELGMTTTEIEEILGEPTAIYEDNIWCWYEKKAAKKISAIENLGEDLDEDSDLEDLENELENADKEYEELENMTFKCIIVEFDGNGKVYKVVFDTEHKYDAFEPYLVDTKEVESVETNLDDVVLVTKTITETTLDDGTTSTETDVKIPAVNIEYAAKFTDGSYVLYTANPKVTLQEKTSYGSSASSGGESGGYGLRDILRNPLLLFNGDKKKDHSTYKNPATLTWQDDIAEYEETIDTKISAFNLSVKGESVTLTAYSGNSGYSGYSIETVIIPDNVTSISEDAFGNCKATKIIIPDSLVSFPFNAFDHWNSLTDIQVSENHPNYKSIDGVLYSKDATSLIMCPKGKTSSSFEIPDSVTSIGDAAFYNCKNLTSVAIGDSVTYIGDEAFYNCKSLTSVVIGDSVTYIGDMAFGGCAKKPPYATDELGNIQSVQSGSLTSVIFKNTSGWWVSASSTATSGKSVDVTDPSTAAEYLTDTYCSYYWKQS